MVGEVVDVMGAIGSSPLTPITLTLMSISLIITAFAKGWIVSAFQVKQLLEVQNLRIAEAIERIKEANQRADEYRLEVAKRDKIISDQASQLDLMKVTAENTNRLLTSLPTPKGT